MVKFLDHDLQIWYMGGKHICINNKTKAYYFSFSSEREAQYFIDNGFVEEEDVDYFGDDVEKEQWIMDRLYDYRKEYEKGEIEEND